MTRAERTVAREIADYLEGNKTCRGPSIPIARPTLQTWLILLAPPQKRRSVSKGTKKRRATTRELDALCREVVFLRDQATCVFCGKPAIDWSHIYSRRFKWIRWDPLNSCASCKGCHIYFHHRPADGMELVKEWLGPQKYDTLRLKAGKPQKADPDKWRLYLLGEAKKLGVTLEGK